MWRQEEKLRTARRCCHRADAAAAVERAGGLDAAIAVSCLARVALALLLLGSLVRCRRLLAIVLIEAELVDALVQAIRVHLLKLLQLLLLLLVMVVDNCRCG